MTSGCVTMRLLVMFEQKTTKRKHKLPFPILSAKTLTAKEALTAKEGERKRKTQSIGVESSS